MADNLFYFFRQCVFVLLSVLDLTMIVRAVTSWLDPTGESKVFEIAYLITEPFILPFRALCDRFHWFEGVPFDIPFLMTWLTLSVIDTLLTAL